MVRLAGVDAGGKEAAKRDGFRVLWRKVKPEGYSSEVRAVFFRTTYCIASVC